MAGCDVMSTSILFDCASVGVNGNDDTIIILPFAEVDKTLSTLDVNNSCLVTNLVMKAGKTGLKIQGTNYSVDFEEAMAKGKYLDSYEPKITFRVFSNSATVKKQLEGLKGSRWMVLHKNRTSTATVANAWEVSGWDTGLELGELTRNQADADTHGGFVGTFIGDETNKEISMSKTIFKTDAATTDAMVAALVTA